MHPHANAFEIAAEEYEQGRPGYAPELVEWLGSRGHLTAGCTVVDLGAGTGKLTRILVDCAAHIIAVEPLAAMRDQFRQILPDIEILDATADALPMDDKSVDMVICSQSFRWFATDSALAEIARVLIPDGELIIAFNRADETSPVQLKVRELLSAVDADTEERKPGAEWREVLFANPNFEFTDEIELPNPHFVDRARLTNRLRSSSQFSRLSLERQDQLTAELYDLTEGDLVNLGQTTTAIAMRRIEPH